MPSTALTIILPDVSSQVTIAADWFAKRDELLAAAGAVRVVNTADACDQAGEFIRKLGKLAKALEDQRKQITDPFLKAQKLIKTKADEALAAVGAETERLKAQVAEFAARQQQQADERARQAEAARRAEIERQVADLEAANAANQQQADKEAELLGTDPAVFQPPPAIVVPEAAPVVAAPKIDGVRVSQALTFEVVNPDEVPRRFLCVDTHAIRMDLLAHKDEYMARLKDDPSWTPAPGVVVRIETKVASR